MNHALFIEIAGWIPAVVFPVATLLQLVKLHRESDARGLSRTTWILFGIANLGLYFYAEKYLAVQTIAGFLGTAALDFTIAGYATLLLRKKI